jgi:hypothetical protein
MRCGYTPAKALAPTATGKFKTPATAAGPPAKHWRGKMTEYMQTLINICFTMVTAVVVVASLGSIAFMGMLFWNMLEEFFD